MLAASHFGRCLWRLSYIGDSHCRTNVDWRLMKLLHLKPLARRSVLAGARFSLSAAVAPPYNWLLGTDMQQQDAALRLVLHAEQRQRYPALCSQH